MEAPDSIPAVLTAARARASGCSHLLRDGSYRRVAHGVYLVSGADPGHPDVRIALATASLAPAVVVGGWASGRLHERRRAGRRAVLQFDGLTGPPFHPRPVLLLAGPETRMSPQPFRELVRSRVPDGEREVVDGVPVTTPLRTAFDIARRGDLQEGVRALDRLRSLGLVSESELSRFITERARWPGAGRARRALAFSSDRVESGQESVLRTLWCEAGLPRPRSNAVVEDRDGRFVARVDVLDAEAGLVGEYDGAVHASARRRSADAARQERLEALGLVVVRATAVDVASEAGRVAWAARLREAWDRARRRRPADRAWTVR